ncbi:MAG: guanylate kinase [Acidobacteria bacterium]|nr:guanylate kinase [Acidobacteriota bacterium]
MIGNLIIVTAPSGTGKTTLVNGVMKRDDHVKQSISFTSRMPRAGEIDGVHYHFVTRERFNHMVDRGEFLEWAQVHGNFYGTSLREVEDLRGAQFDVILTIDVQGARSARTMFPEAISIFILPPSYQSLVERLSARGTDATDDLKVRLDNALGELAHFQSFDYLVINDDLGWATAELSSIIIAERCRRDRRAAIAEKILQTFNSLWE